MSYERAILITGVTGFIASNFVLYMVCKYPQLKFIGINKSQKYKNIEHVMSMPNFRLYTLNILSDDINKVFTENNIGTIIHFAAYTNVGKSFTSPIDFTLNNILATHILLEYANQILASKFIYISTDEVYGYSTDLLTEDSPINPTNPYAATKAAAEHLVRSYYYSYKLPIMIIREGNVYGPQQYPDKAIPLFILRLLNDQKCQIQGTGEVERTFLFIDDVIRAFECIFIHGKSGETYNVSSNIKISIAELASSIIKIIKPNDECDKWIEYIKDRNFNSNRPTISTDKIKSLGWKQETTIDVGLELTIEWYKHYFDFAKFEW